MPLERLKPANVWYFCLEMTGTNDQINKIVSNLFQVFITSFFNGNFLLLLNCCWHKHDKKKRDGNWNATEHNQVCTLIHSFPHSIAALWRHSTCFMFTCCACWVCVAHTWSRRCASQCWGPGGTAHHRSSVCIPHRRANSPQLEQQQRKRSIKALICIIYSSYA